MRIVRLYTPQNIALDADLELDDTIRHYAVNVLRLNKHSKLKLFNGDGFDYACKILDINKTVLRVKISEQINLNCESALTTHLYLAISKSSHMDYAIQKTVEAGVNYIQPIITERTAHKLTPKSAENKHQHWQRIIQSACEQCGRAVIPKLDSVMDFNTIKPLDDNEFGLLFSADADKTMHNLGTNTPSTIKLLIGPEGGLTESENHAAIKKGFQAIRLGPRVLRTETAALAAALSAQLLWGDLAQ